MLRAGRRRRAPASDRPLSVRRALAVALLISYAFAAHAERIREYKTFIRLLPNGALQVQEEIAYDFGSAKRHGIYRDVPRWLPDPALGGRWLRIRPLAILRDGHPEPWDDADAPIGFVRWRIGNPRGSLSGTHRYTIRYEVGPAIVAASLGRDML
ncbi:MAG: DUF2207 domain-containing protein, partial [Zetaproteobacteria bacterium]